jgi:hypothetical protein
LAGQPLPKPYPGKLTMHSAWLHFVYPLSVRFESAPQCRNEGPKWGIERRAKQSNSEGPLLLIRSQLHETRAGIPHTQEIQKRKSLCMTRRLCRLAKVLQSDK